MSGGLVLLATDGSEYSNGAAKFLTCLNLSPDDEIVVFHAVYCIPFLHDTESYFETFKEIKKEVAPRIIDSALTILKPVKAKISTAIIDASPEQSIIDEAAGSDIDSVIMGARGIKGIKSFLIGSVTRSVAIKSPKPVLVTKLPVCENPDKMKVLFATDGSDYSIAAGKYLCKLPFQDNTGLTILAVIPSHFLDVPRKFVPEISERMVETADKIRSMRFSASERIVHQAKRYFSKRFRNIDVLLEAGDPSTAILKAAGTLRTDLIVVGCRGLRGIKGMLGSVSRNILAHSKCSVLIDKTCQE